MLLSGRGVLRCLASAAEGAARVAGVGCAPGILGGSGAKGHVRTHVGAHDEGDDGKEPGREGGASSIHERLATPEAPVATSGGASSIHERLATPEAPVATSGEILDTIVPLVTRARAKDLSVVSLRNNTLCDCFLIATGASTDHLQRIAGGVKYTLKQRFEGLSPRIEGPPGSEWVMVDASTVFIHLLTREARGYYDLEGLHASKDHSNVRDILNAEDLSAF